MAKHSKSSKRWLKEHFQDEFVRRAQAAGYRSRAVFKLLEIDEKDRILRPGLRVIDLGAAPGGWSQVVADRVGDRGRVIALDILPMDALAGVEFIQADFQEEEGLRKVMEALDGTPVDLVLSDMAPNISGMKAVDQPRATYLTELALDLARQVLKPGGDLVVKAFQGEGFDEIFAEMKRNFAKVIVRKPKASRGRSREVYVLARNYHL